MLKGKCIHPDIMRLLSLCGHGDKVLIADGNYPLAAKTGDAEKVWLGLTAGAPAVPDVLDALLGEINIEKAEVMRPDDGSVPAIFDEFKSRLPGLGLSPLGRFEVYDACCVPAVRLAISTGERRTYANLLITVGVS